ncbi:MAG: hypothetical protein WDO68_26865 [Gammaproteobacteria bacterium]
MEQRRTRVIYAAFAGTTQASVAANEIRALSGTPNPGQVSGSTVGFNCPNTIGFTDFPSFGTSCKYIGWRWQAPSSGLAQLTIASFSGSIIAVQRDNSLSQNCTQVVFPNQASIFPTHGTDSLSFSATQGQTYCIWVGGVGTGGTPANFPEGSVTINYNLPQAPQPPGAIQGADVPTLSEWAAILLAMGLMAAMILSGRRGSLRR